MKINLSFKYAKNKSFNLNIIAARHLKRKTPKVASNRTYNKVFCIGFHKTGTTSLESALKSFGFRLGNQPAAEMLTRDYLNGEFQRILDFCYTAEAFQDTPFGYPGMFKAIDKEFPESKFILTVRDSPDQWFSSLTKFHTKLFSSNKSHLPTEEDLKNAVYRYKGYALETKRTYGYPKVPIYDKEKYTEYYCQHIEDVKKHFKNRQNDLLILNVSENGSYKRLADFLEVKGLEENAPFPWLNRTSE